MGTLDLGKKWLLVSLLILAVAITAVSGVVLGNLSNTSAQKSVTVTIQGDNTVYVSDKASIPVKWGTINIGENTKTVTITNQANVNLKAHLSTANLPQGWMLTFSLDNQPIAAGYLATGTLTLIVPGDTHVGSYNWGASIMFDGTKK